jgi:hypothetical protein
MSFADYYLMSDYLLSSACGTVLMNVLGILGKKGLYSDNQQFEQVNDITIQVV